MGRTIDQLTVGDKVFNHLGGTATITNIDGDVVTTSTGLDWGWDGEQLTTLTSDIDQGAAADGHTIALADLKLLPQWVGYLLVPKPNGKTDKIPKDPHTGRNGSSTDPNTWGTAAQAWAAKMRYRLDGIGFVFTVASGIVGVDLDDCFHFPEPDGIKRLKPWARDVVQCLDSYTELSPSGQGLHILCQGAIPYSITKNKIGFEMYNEARFFTVTGNVLGDVADIRKCSTELVALHLTFEDAPRIESLPNLKPNISNPPSKDDIRTMLSVIPVHQDYLDWLRCLMAIHDAYPGDEGVRLVEDWSPGFRGEVANKFRSFDRTAKEGVGIGTLIHMAKLNGWQPRKRKAIRYAENIGRLMAA